MSLDDLSPDLWMIVSEVYARPDVPIESEGFFEDIANSFQGSKEECLSYIRNHVKNWFRCSNKPPTWIQEAEWQFSNGKPMIFVGQVDVSASSGLFHDDASFYTFYSPENDEIKTLVQVS